MAVLLWIQSQKLPELIPSLSPNWAQTVETCFFSMAVGHTDFSFTVFWDIYPVPSFPLSLLFHLLGPTLLHNFQLVFLFPDSLSVLASNDSFLHVDFTTSVQPLKQLPHQD